MAKKMNPAMVKPRHIMNGPSNSDIFLYAIIKGGPTTGRKGAIAKKKHKIDRPRKFHEKSLPLFPSNLHGWAG